MPKVPLAVQLGEFAAGLRFEELPAAVVDKAKAFVNHAVTVGLAGSAHPRSVAARRAVLEHERLEPRRVGAGQGATLLGYGGRAGGPGVAVTHGKSAGVDLHTDYGPLPTTPGVPSSP